MFYKVKIKKQPKARTGYQVQGGLVNDVPAMGGKDYNAYIGAPDMKVNRSLTAVPREDANLEAEGGETVMGNIDGSNIPSFYTIKGPRHASGGVPLNLPDDSFIFSDTKSMKISDPTLLKMFGLSNKKGGYTPAEMSKKYDINKYRQVLQDPDTDKIARKTAEIMIKNAVMKLGALALAQESKKGFPQGIPAIAKPYMEANQIPEEELIPKEEAPQQQAPEDQMSQGEEGVGPEQEMPMNMPNGEPIAMPEEMPEASPEQMMEAPMAQYGMSMGGYDFPYHPNEMAYGGYIPRAQDGLNYTVNDEQGNQVLPTDNYVPPSVPTKPDLSNWDSMEELEKFNIIHRMKTTPQMFTPEELEMYSPSNEIPPEVIERMQSLSTDPIPAVPNNAYGGLYRFIGGGITRYDRGGGKERPMTEAELQERRKKAKDIKKIKGKKCPEGYILQDGFCVKGTITEGEAAQSSLGKAKGKGTGVKNPAWEKTICAELSKGVSPEQLAANGHGTADGIRKRFKDCIKKGEEAIKTGKEDFDVLQLEDETPEITTTPGKKCQCPDPMDSSKWIDVECPEDGSEPDCGGEEEEVQGQYAMQPPRNPKWWLQDTVNTMGAFGDLMRTKKYMPWEARVDLEEPRPTFLDPTRELAAQSEQANIASQAAAQFAGPQALGARLAAIQGQGAASAANTLSNINNQNVNIANQFEANQVGVRNQEQMLNQQMANRVYDKNVIANQQFDNAITAGRANLRNAYNTGLTNRAKTDAMNQMYPNYQVDPTTGGLVNYTPTDKTVTAGEDEMTAEEYAQSISKYDPKIQQKLMDIKFGKRYGGQMFEHGGYVYATYPMILL